MREEKKQLTLDDLARAVGEDHMLGHPYHEPILTKEDMKKYKISDEFLLKPLVKDILVDTTISYYLNNIDKINKFITNNRQLIDEIIQNDHNFSIDDNNEELFNKLSEFYGINID